MQTSSVMSDVGRAVQGMADQLAIHNPAYYVWQLKNDNHGLLIFDGDQHNYEEVKSHLPQGVALLGFCPIF